MNRSDLISYQEPPANMKMQPEHFQRLRAACATVLDNNPDARAKYLARDIPRGDRVQDINKRLRWDVGSRAIAHIAPGLMQELYAYLNDTHIDTALRVIILPIEQESAL